MERNNAVFGQVFFWAQYLTPAEDLFTDAYPFLALAPLQHFELPVGIDDKAWLPKEEAEEVKVLDAEEADENVLSANSVSGNLLRLQL